MIETGIYDLLSSESSISALVADRIYPLLLPTGGIYPAMTYQIVGGQSMPTLTTSGLQKIMLQVDCWDESYLDAVSVRAAVVSFLNRRSGQLSDGTFLQAAMYLQPLDFFSGGDELFRSAAEFDLFFYFPI